MSHANNAVVNSATQNKTIIFNVTGFMPVQTKRGTAYSAWLFNAEYGDKSFSVFNYLYKGKEYDSIDEVNWNLIKAVKATEAQLLPVIKDGHFVYNKRGQQIFHLSGFILPQEDISLLTGGIPAPVVHTEKSAIITAEVLSDAHDVKTKKVKVKSKVDVQVAPVVQCEATVDYETCEDLASEMLDSDEFYGNVEAFDKRRDFDDVRRNKHKNTRKHGKRDSLWDQLLDDMREDQ